MKDTKKVDETKKGGRKEIRSQWQEKRKIMGER